MHAKQYTYRQHHTKEVCYANTRMEIEQEARSRVQHGKVKPVISVWNGHLEEPLPKFPDHEVSVGKFGGITWTSL